MKHNKENIIKLLEAMRRKDVLREMEVTISLVATESKCQEIKLSSEEYRSVHAIREYCNRIIEEELWK